MDCELCSTEISLALSLWVYGGESETGLVMYVCLPSVLSECAFLCAIFSLALWAKLDCASCGCTHKKRYLKKNLRNY